MEDYGKISDEELIRMLRKGRKDVTDYLLIKYKPLVRSMTRARFICGGDSDDLVQEGMIGLFKAIRDYDEEKSTLFMTFARLCIERQITTAVIRANRKKHSPLNSSEPLEEELVQQCTMGSPEALLIDRENSWELMQGIYDRLSVMEKQVFDHYLEGMDSVDIAKSMGKSQKSVENAIQRIKRKVRETCCNSKGPGLV